MADDDQRKTTSRELHDHLDEERTSVMLAMFETDGSEDDDEGDEDMSEYSDDSFQASSLRSGIEGEYTDYDDYSNYEEIEEDDIDPDLLSYEELIALGELVGVESRGLSEVEITKSLHPSTFQSLTSKTLVDRCVVCQLEYDEGEKLVALPCDHPYHCECITTWLQIKKVFTLLIQLQFCACPAGWICMSNHVARNTSIPRKDSYLICQ
nr:E3 ubiquitin ligase BIG BROTHER-related-like [Ipomoea batatas]